jgi:CRISPR type IV-associated protein Csf3
MSYEPLRITARLQTPVICDDRLPLDGVLFYFAMRERYGFEVSTVPGNAIIGDDADKRRLVPFKVYYRNVSGRDYWFYQCSFARWVGTVAEGRDYWVKRFDQNYSSIVDFKGKRGKVITKSGRYKGYRMPVFTRHALAVRWYAVGDRREVERLLNFCTHLGKKESQGYGAVLNWVVEPWSEDWSIRSPQGLMRAVPSETGLCVGFRPSYWSQENQAVCQMPESYADVS